jgi:hypothetical protein
MSYQTITREALPHTGRAATTATTATTQTRRLLSAGMAAGPVFLGTWALQALTRSGFDPTKHPLSLLALGELGWIQIATFVVTGSLLIAYGSGVGEVLTQGPGSTWGPRLIKLMGMGFVVSGVFLTDAGAGFPQGAPAGMPEMTWHGLLHELGSVMVSASWIAACFVLRRRFKRLDERAWKHACVAVVAVVLAIVAVPHLESFTIRIAIGTALQLGYLAVLAARLKREGTPRPTPSIA